VPVEVENPAFGKLQADFTQLFTECEFYKSKLAELEEKYNGIRTHLICYK
jgi:hypothetical protein